MHGDSILDSGVLAVQDASACPYVANDQVRIGAVTLLLVPAGSLGVRDAPEADVHAGSERALEDDQAGRSLDDDPDGSPRRGVCGHRNVHAWTGRRRQLPDRGAALTGLVDHGTPEV